ncbi:hypothetical protein [Pseudohaliea sp.]|uniref:hypothetical protein n=1 Tax=Pseudohaliea sp. TaxID=2740289 RepID=UPI0032EB0459
MPEQQADAQAELMAEAFGFYADNLLTRDHFTEVLNARFSEQEARIDARFAEQDARMDARFAQQDVKLEQRFAAQDAKFEPRFTKLERRQGLQTWMLGLITAAVVLPQLQAWLA